MAAITKRSTSKGVHYRVLIRLQGHPQLCRTFPNKSEASAWATKQEDAIRKGIPPESTDSFETLIAVFCKSQARAHLRTQYRVTTLLEEWADDFGAYTIGKITTAMVSKRLDAYLASGLSNATVNRRRAALSSFFKWCVKQGTVDINPVTRTDRLTEPRGRVRYLSDGERVALFKACKASGCAMLYPLVVVACYSGMRRGELLALDWADVDMATGQATIQQSKNGERRSTMILGPALEALRQWRDDSMGGVPFIGRRRVFPLWYPEDAWNRARIAAGIKDFHFHDLRHTAASYLAMMGASNMELKSFLGHKSLAMVSRYAHLSPAHMATVVGKMAERFR
jgi:integrase